MTAAKTSRWARRFSLAGALFLPLWGAAALLGGGRRLAVVLGLLGFVFHTVFGKAYALVPTYFDRELATTRAMPAHLALAVAGAGGLALDAAASLPRAGALGSALWTAGVALFLGTLLWSLRGNLAGRETATGGTDAERRPVDRAANAAMPVALAYLGAGSYALLAARTPLPSPLGGFPPRASHLLAAGAAALLLFSVGFRLLPRFFVASPPRALVAVVLPAGAVGPALLAVGVPSGVWLRVGAAVETVAVVGFAAAVAALFARSDRRRVGLYGVLAGAGAGVLAVGLGLVLAFAGRPAGVAAAHVRLNLLGFLGLSIVGVTYQFYPPAVGTFPGGGDRTALAVLVLLAGGLLAQVVGFVGGLSPLVTAGRLGVFAGGVAHASLVAGLLWEHGG